jgi:hypothetical protein
MLAYVFWHWRRPDVERAAYDRHLVEFHAALKRAAPSGFHASSAFRSGAAPWVAGAESYEDWYLVGGSASLDPLNDGAVTGDCKEPHDMAARLAAGGVAGLYRLRMGSADLGRARWACWFSKPSGMTYAGLYSAMEPFAARLSSALWGRQMTLGPTPEFCLIGPGPIEIGMQGIVRELAPIWPSA